MSDKYTRRRIASTSITTVISLSLVLFLFGMLGLVVLSAKKLTDHVKENIGFQVYLKDDAKAEDITAFQSELDKKPYVRSTEFISKTKALELYKKDLGDDFLPILDFNPLPASFDLRLVAGYANNDSIARIRTEVLANPTVSEFSYRESLVDLVNTRISALSLYFLIFIGLLMIVAIALINNTIRLSIYSRRFLIRTMLLVGATQGFIRKPFILLGIMQGIAGAVFATGMIAGALYFITRELPYFTDVFDTILFLTLFGLVVLAGIVISWTSTWLAVRKYLRLKTEDLYN